MQLLKYDFKSILAVCLPAYALTALGFLSNLILLTVQDSIGDSLSYEIFSIIDLIYGITNFFIYLLVVFTAIYIITDFYKTVFGKIGYLTHTLPVKPAQILLSKLVSGMCMLGLSSFVTTFAIVFLDLYATQWYLDFWTDPDFMYYVIPLLFAVCAVELLQMLCVFFAIALAHLTKHKVGLSIVFYLLLYQIFGNIPLIGSFLLMEGTSFSNINYLFWFYGLLCLLLSPLPFYGTLHIMRNKLNLE